MTTPVFMENDKEESAVPMGFVMPKDIAVGGVPGPTGEGVDVRKRVGGRFAVLRFSGQLPPVQPLISDLLNDCRFANALESKAYGFQDRFGGAF